MKKELLRNLEFGYYQVGDTIHASKVQALIDGTARNIHPEWKFNNHIFDHVDWSAEPTASLDDLYTKRARQLREKYDYLVLLYSAGSDCQNILEVCLRNNIRIDELIVIHPLSFANLYRPDSTNFEDSNVLSEWDLTMKPRLEWIEHHHPEIKITVYDWWLTAKDYKVKDGYVTNRSHNLTPYFETRNNLLCVPRVKDLLDKHDKVGFILGVDKPRVCYHENAYRIYFLDILTNTTGTQSDPNTRRYQINAEFFYWNPECVDILAKQAHILARFFESAPAFRSYVTWPITRPNSLIWYENTIRALIYPSIDVSVFQANKPDLTVGFDKLLFLVGKQKEIERITQENFSYLRQNIDSKYLTERNGNPTFVGFITGMWPVKKVN